MISFDYEKMAFAIWSKKKEQEEFGDVGWDLFLLLNNINREHDGDSYGEDDHEVFVHPPEFEVLFGQFAN